MAVIYYDLINMGLKTISDVPLRWRTTVQDMLNKDKPQTEDGE